MSLVSEVAAEVVGARGFLQYPSPYPVDEYTSRYVSCLGACLLAMMTGDRILTVKIGAEEHGTVFVECRCR